MNLKILLLAGVALCALSGASDAAGKVGDCTNCGTVRGLETMSKAGEATGKGALLGAVIGGVVGHQMGSGKGNTAATIGGAAAGGYAGHQVEKNRNSGTYTRVTVEMDTGGKKEVDVTEPAGLKPGDRVRVTGSNLERVEG